MQLSRVGCASSSSSSLTEFKGFVRVASIKEDACRSSRNFDTKNVDFKQSWQLSSTWCCPGMFPSGRVFNATCRQGEVGKRFLPFASMSSKNRRTEPTMVARSSLQSQPWEADDDALLADSPPYLLQTGRNWIRHVGLENFGRKHFLKLRWLPLLHQLRTVLRLKVKGG